MKTGPWQFYSCRKRSNHPLATQPTSPGATDVKLQPQPEPTAAAQLAASTEATGKKPHSLTIWEEVRWCHTMLHPTAPIPLPNHSHGELLDTQPSRVHPVLCSSSALSYTNKLYQHSRGDSSKQPRPVTPSLEGSPQKGLWEPGRSTRRGSGSAHPMPFTDT